MTGKNSIEQFDDLSDLDYEPRIRNFPEAARKRLKESLSGVKKPVKLPEIVSQMEELIDREEEFRFTYRASRHERGWLEQSLGNFYVHHWIDDVLRLVKGGKEANVYMCRANPTVLGLDHAYLATKVYRPRRFRNLKNDHLYREGRDNLDEGGRVITDDRMQRAMIRRTEYGRELLHTSWIEHEVKTVDLLFTAGADVPRVLASGENAILMDYIGDEKQAAPVLYDVKLSLQEARRLFERVIGNVELMLANQRIHGDLSAFNILYWDGEITLIDFPQAIDPTINRNAFNIFQRDLSRICEYFFRQGVKSNPRRLASEMWKSQHLKMIPDVHPRLLDSEDREDRLYWQRWIEKDG